MKSEYTLAIQVPNGFLQKPQHSAGSAEMDGSAASAELEQSQDIH